jgi:hypothetical protein
MAARLHVLIDRIREEKGPFFVARVALRINFPLNKSDLAFGPEHEKQVVDACRDLGFDVTAFGGAGKSD